MLSKDNLFQNLQFFKFCLHCLYQHLPSRRFNVANYILLYYERRSQFPISRGNHNVSERVCMNIKKEVFFCRVRGNKKLQPLGAIFQFSVFPNVSSSPHVFYEFHQRQDKRLLLNISNLPRSDKFLYTHFFACYCMSIDSTVNILKISSSS